MSKFKRFWTAAVLPTGAAARERKEEIRARQVARSTGRGSRQDAKIESLSASDKPKDQDKARLLEWRREHPQETGLSRGGLMTLTVKLGHLYDYGADKGYIAGAQAFLDDSTGSRHSLTRVVTVAGAFTKKKTGHGTLTIAMADGSTVTSRVSADRVAQVAPWVHAFNAYAASLPAAEPS